MSVLELYHVSKTFFKPSKNLSICTSMAYWVVKMIRMWVVGEFLHMCYKYRRNWIVTFHLCWVYM